jgi:competence protein ComEA
VEASSGTDYNIRASPASTVGQAMDTPPSSTPEPVSGALRNSREAQVALGVLLFLTVGLLAFRGYGNGLRAHPTDVRPNSLNLNRAEQGELEQVPGIGPARAKAIVDFRRQHGLFESVDELRQVKGIGPATLNQVRPFVQVYPESGQAGDTVRSEPLVLGRKPTVNEPASRPRGVRKLQPGDPPININTASYEELLQLPGVGPVIAHNILQARREQPFRTLGDLDRVKNIGAKTLDKLRPFVIFEPLPPSTPR